MRTFLRLLLTLVLAGSLISVFSGCSANAKKSRHFARAEKYFAAGDYDRAEIEYMNVLQLEAMHPGAIAGLGLIYFDQGRTGRLYAVLMKARELRPENLEVRVRVAMFHLAAGQRAEARADALFVLERRPLDPDAPLLLAEAAGTEAEAKDAQARLQQLPAAAQAGAPVLVALGSIEFRLKHLAQARAYVDRALAADPKSSAAYQARGQLDLAEKNVAAAGSAFARAAELAPLRSPKQIQYARFQLQAGHPDLARKKLEELTRKVPDFLPAWMSLAEMAANAKQYDEAIASVGKVLARDSVNPEAMVLQIRLLNAKGDRDKAIVEAERAVKVYPKGAEFHFQLGALYAATGETGKALASATQAAALAPDAIGTTLLLAELNKRQGNFDAAATALRKLLEKNPNLPQAWVALAEVYRTQRRFDDSLDVLRRFARAYPGNPQTQLMIGLAHLQQANAAEARAAFTRSLEIAPDYLPAMEQLVNLDLAQKDYAAAVQRVQSQIAKDPKQAGPQLVLTKVYLAQGDMKQAEATLLNIIALQPDLPTPYILLARLYISTKRHEQALARLAEAVARNPKDVDSLMMIASINEQRKNYPVARENYEKLLAINPKFNAALNNLACLYSEQFGEPDKAYALAQRARELRPNEPHIADTLGWILHQRGQYPWALTLLTESAEKLPGSAVVQFHLGMTYYMMGKEELARATLEAALTADANFAGAEEAHRALGILAIDPAKAGAGVAATLEKAPASKSDPVAQTRLGALYARDGKTDAATAAYESALRLSPANVQPATELIRLYDARGDTAKALELAKATRKLAPADADVAYLLGRLAYRSADYPWAASLLQEAVRKRPDNADVLVDFAAATYCVGNIDAATSALRDALQRSPTAPQAAKARQFLELIQAGGPGGGAATAAATIEQALKQDPNSAPALMAKAVGAEQRGDARTALQSYELLMAKYPQFTPAMRAFVIVSAAAPGNEPKAAAIGAKAREAFPDDALLARALGIVAYRQANYPRAASLLDESVRARPDDAELLYYLGMSRCQSGDRATGTTHLKRALELNLPADLAAKARSTIAQKT